MHENQMSQYQSNAPGQAAPITPHGQTVSQGFGSTQTQQNAGTADSAIAAQVKAQVEARYIMAMHRPRNMMVVRANLLNECRRPGFASTARYSKPVGGGAVDGWSIRFAETAARVMTNIDNQQITIFDDDAKRIIRVTVTDLESNTTYSQDLVIEKTVERSKVPPGQKALKTRTNSRGRITYTVEANEGDLVNKELALVSKSIRNLLLRMLPGDIAEDALEVIRETISKDIRENPDAAKRKIVDAFSQIGIAPDQLTKYVGCELAQMTPKDVVDLRTAYSGLKAGEVRWNELMETKQPHGDDAEPKSKGAAMRQKLKARKDAKAEDLIDDEDLGKMFAAAAEKKAAEEAAEEDENE